jgi:hypothetical protein
MKSILIYLQMIIIYISWNNTNLPDKVLHAMDSEFFWSQIEPENIMYSQKIPTYSVVN